jgi:hypothetical protein
MCRIIDMYNCDGEIGWILFFYISSWIIDMYNCDTIGFRRLMLLDVAKIISIFKLPFTGEGFATAVSIVTDAQILSFFASMLQLPLR